MKFGFALGTLSALLEFSVVHGSQIGMGHVDVSQLKQTLDTGGAEALAGVLSTMKLSQALQSDDQKNKNLHITKAADGSAMYDFSQPVLPPTTTTTTTKAPTTHAAAAMLGLKSSVAGGKMQRLQGGNQLQALVRGLESIREKVDTLAEEAVASVQGQTGMDVGAADAGASGVSSDAGAGGSVDPQQMQALMDRMTAMENDNVKLHSEILDDKRQIKGLVAENTDLTEKMAKIMQHKHNSKSKHLRK
mmetsp:Transcript_2266/g.2975  ORF Transcript_2266/g.2975 Transcript_2266/m.2975 type:complete len:247 (+) Transcript_2266:84-824(+)